MCSEISGKSIIQETGRDGTETLHRLNREVGKEAGEGSYLCLSLSFSKGISLPLHHSLMLHHNKPGDFVPFL